MVLVLRCNRGRAASKDQWGPKLIGFAPVGRQIKVLRLIFWLMGVVALVTVVCCVGVGGWGGSAAGRGGGYICVMEAARPSEGHTVQLGAVQVAPC